MDHLIVSVYNLSFILLQMWKRNHPYCIVARLSFVIIEIPSIFEENFQSLSLLSFLQHEDSTRIGVDESVFGTFNTVNTVGSKLAWLLVTQLMPQLTRHYGCVSVCVCAWTPARRLTTSQKDICLQVKKHHLTKEWKSTVCVCVCMCACV